MIINKNDVVCFTDLIARFESMVKGKGFVIDKAAKNKSRKNVKDEFSTTATIFQNNERRLIFLPNDFSREELSIELIDLENDLIAIFHLLQQSKQSI